MNKVFTLLYAILLVLSSGWTAEAQIKTVAAEMKKAELDYNSFRYVSAISRLTKVLAADSGHIGAQEMLAYSYAQIRDYDKAVTAYAKVCSHPNPKPESALHFAELLAIKQQYEKSEQWYRKYLRLAPQDKRAQAFGRANLSELSKQNGTWQIHFCNINTSASEYSPTFFKHGLLFCSNRMGRGFTWSVFPWDNTPYTKFFFVDNILNIREDIQSKKTQDSQKINRYYVFNDDNTEETSNDSKILGCTDESFVKSFQTDSKERFSIARRLRGNINSGYHAGPLSVFPDGSVIFTRNNFYRGRAGRSKDGINKLKLYTATGNKLSSVKPFLYNSDEYSTGHPAVSKDGSILVFASDMPGGYGGTDLYYCVRSGRGEWTRPVNLGKTVNTEGNEQFPFLSGDNTLYFASNGHVGFGGLDLFFVKLKEMKPVEPLKIWVVLLIRLLMTLD
ncbi:hypothetical protein [Arcticibacter sp. MXS-1]|uniref:hypothetical protein n=1 Tax=Arcticibacter sp. MXS-1 TaxID=3341726 RepID=UPI0035A9A3E4